ncbi:MULTISPECIES: hypothetical protein [unclassified Vibrio]|uniref:hypothetical protein n=1 Tax=unclassified Vibrio TaxID=2614977 RepID=UPI0012E8E17F|nr:MULTISPECIES: hypothetical protein [unclassified Vibrio]
MKKLNFKMILVVLLAYLLGAYNGVIIPTIQGALVLGLGLALDSESPEARYAEYYSNEKFKIAKLRLNNECKS